MPESDFVNKCFQELKEPSFLDFFSENTSLIFQDVIYLIDSQKGDDMPLHSVEIFGAEWPAYQAESLSRLEKMYIVENTDAISRIVSNYFNSEILMNSTEKAELEKTALENRALVFAVDAKNGVLFRDAAREKHVAAKLAKMYGRSQTQNITPKFAQNSSEPVSGTNAEQIKSPKELEHVVFNELLSSKSSIFQYNLKKSNPTLESFLVFGGRFYALSPGGIIFKALAASENESESKVFSGKIRLNGREYFLNPIASLEEIANDYRKVLAEEIIMIAEKHDIDKGSLTIANMKKENFMPILEQFRRNDYYERNNLGILKLGTTYYVYIWVNNRKPYALTENPANIKYGNKYYFDSIKVAVKIEMSSRGEVLPPCPEGFIVTPYHHPFVGDSNNKFVRVCAEKEAIQKSISDEENIADKYYAVLKCVENTLLSGYRPNAAEHFVPHHPLTLTEFPKEYERYGSIPEHERPEVTNVFES